MLETSGIKTKISPLKVKDNSHSDSTFTHRGFFIIGHRGCNGGTSHLSGADALGDVPLEMLPENTLQALHKGMFDYARNQDKRDGNEFDVYITLDGIPVICHDDDLNRNVAGANRKGKELGSISQLNLGEVFCHNVGQGKIIPPVETALISLGTFNTQRQAIGLRNIIFNIELKGVGTARAVYPVVQRTISSFGRIAHDDIIYCSSSVDELKELRLLAPHAQIAFAVNTEQFFGAENVTDDFMVSMNRGYKDNFFPWLDSICRDIDFKAIDCTFWDINDDLVDYAKKNSIDIHTIITGNHGINHVTIDRLLDLHERLGTGSDGHSRLYFKTDYPERVKTIMEGRLAVRSELKYMRNHNVEEQLDPTKVVPPGYLRKDSTEQMFTREAVHWPMGVRGRFLRPGQMPEAVGLPVLTNMKAEAARGAEKKDKRAKIAPSGYWMPQEPLSYNPLTLSLLDPCVPASSMPPASYRVPQDLNMGKLPSHFTDTPHLGSGCDSPTFGLNDSMNRGDGSLSSSFSLPLSPSSPHHRTIQTLHNTLFERSAQKASNAQRSYLKTHTGSSGSNLDLDTASSKKARLGVFEASLVGNLDHNLTSTPSSSLHPSQKESDQSEHALRPAPGAFIPSSHMQHRSDQVHQLGMPDKQLLSVNQSNSQSREFNTPDSASLTGEKSRINSIKPVYRNLLQGHYRSYNKNLPEQDAGAALTATSAENSQLTSASRSDLYKSFDKIAHASNSSPIFMPDSCQNSKDAFVVSQHVLAQGSNAVMLMPGAAQTSPLDATRIMIYPKTIIQKSYNENACQRNAVESRSQFAPGF